MDALSPIHSIQEVVLTSKAAAFFSSICATAVASMPIATSKGGDSVSIASPLNCLRNLGLVRYILMHLRSDLS
jgi:hypothetical protein